MHAERHSIGLRYPHAHRGERQRISKGKRYLFGRHFYGQRRSPRRLLGHLTLLGTADFTYLGRNPGENPLGTFTTEISNFVFTGMLNGNTFEVKQDPGKTSTGSTTIVQATIEPPTYAVSGSLEIFALYSFNGSPFLPAPPRTADLDPIPEPGSGVLVGSLLVGVIGIASRRRRVR